MKKTASSIRNSIKIIFDAGLNKKYHRAILSIGMGHIPTKQVRRLNNGIVVLQKRNFKQYVEAKNHG